MLGASITTALYIYATPTPIAMSVNMLGDRLRIDCQPRTKNGQPHQSTTGVLKRIAANATNRLPPRSAHSEKHAPFQEQKPATPAPHRSRIVAPCRAVPRSLLRRCRSEFWVRAPYRRLGNCQEDPARSADASGTCRPSLPAPIFPLA